MDNGINRLINRMNRLITGLSQSVDGIHLLINVFGPGLGLRAAGPPVINQPLNAMNESINEIKKPIKAID